MLLTLDVMRVDRVSKSVAPPSAIVWIRFIQHQTYR